MNVVDFQPAIWNVLLKSIHLNKLSNGYLFYGPQGCGKEWTALEFARILNCLNNVSIKDIFYDDNRIVTQLNNFLINFIYLCFTDLPYISYQHFKDLFYITSSAKSLKGNLKT